MSVVCLIIATRSSGPPASGKIIKEMPDSVASGIPYICSTVQVEVNNMYINIGANSGSEKL